MNIYKILETLKKVEEGEVIPFNRAGNNPLRDKNDYLDKRDHLFQQLSKNPNLSQIEKDSIKDRIGQLEKAAQLKGFIEEDSKFTFANPKQKPGDQVRGTEKAIPKKSGEHPFKGRLVGAAESIANIQSEWRQFVAEFGANNPAQGTTTTPQQKAAEIAKSTQGINKLKASGVPIANPTQTTKTLLKDPTDPKTPLTPQDRQVYQTLGQQFDDVITKGDPSQVNQLSAILKNIHDKGGAQ